MIGLFDSGDGGLTIFRTLIAHFPNVRFAYLGDHANAPYGNRSSHEVISLTEAGVTRLFNLGCDLVILACNTATAVACRTLQQDWLPKTRWAGERNVLGIVAPTVEAATQTPWAVQTPQYPQKYNSDTIAVFGTRRTIACDVYREEICKRCPNVTVLQQACPHIAGAIESRIPVSELDKMVEDCVGRILIASGGVAPDKAILGCTHFPLVEHLFRRHLPTATRVLAQPDAVAHSLEDYLLRHPCLTKSVYGVNAPIFLTTGELSGLDNTSSPFWTGQIRFERVAV